MVEDGVVPGLFGFEAGQSAVGDIFAWFVESAVPPASTMRRQRGCSAQELLEMKRNASTSGESGCSRSTGGTATAPCSSTPNCGVADRDDAR